MRQKIDNINITARSPAHLYVLPAVESGPGALLVLICPTQVNLYSLGFLVLGTLQAGLGLHVVRERQMVEDLIELSLGNVGGKPARDLLTVTFPFIKLQLVGDQEESSLKYLFFLFLGLANLEETPIYL